MSNPEHLIVVGPSAAGKTTIVDGLRNPGFEDQLVVPKRFITRGERLGDSKTENEHISDEEFEEKVSNGLLFPHWQRDLGLGKIARYGFENDGSDTRFKIYSANNALLRNMTPAVLDFVQSGLVVFVEAGDWMRRERLQARSPDLTSDEISARLMDDGNDIAHYASEFIDTTTFSTAEGQAALIGIADSVISLP